MLKQSHPEWGCQRISDMLLRGPALPAGAAAVARVLHEAGYQMEERDHASASRQGAAVRAGHAQPALADGPVHLHAQAAEPAACTWWPSWTTTAGSSSATGCTPASRRPWCWRWCGRRSSPTARRRRSSPTTAASTSPGGARASSAGRWSKRGIQQIVAKPQRPQTLGKIERFWGTLWRECLETAVFLDLEDARRRIGHLHRLLQLPAAAPGDRRPGARRPLLRRGLRGACRRCKERVAANALELARNGVPKPPFYVTGQVAGQAFSVHAEGERVILTRAWPAASGGGVGRAAGRQAAAAAPPQPPEPAAGAALPARSAGERRLVPGVVAGRLVVRNGAAVGRCGRRSSRPMRRRRATAEPQARRSGRRCAMKESCEDRWQCVARGASRRRRRCWRPVPGQASGGGDPGGVGRRCFVRPKPLRLLEISLPRYYLWEQRALAGLLAACEPAPRGPRLDTSRQIAALERENRRLRRECDRQQALVRAAERALGLVLPSLVKPSAKPKEEPQGSNGKRRRRVRRPTVRALKASQTLRRELAEVAPERAGCRRGESGDRQDVTPGGRRTAAARREELLLGPPRSLEIKEAWTMARLGRKPQGVGLVAPLAGSKHAKQRMTWFLQTLAGECSVGEACAALGIASRGSMTSGARGCRSRWRLLEPRSPGRPAKPEPTVLPERGAGPAAAGAGVGGPRGGGRSAGGVGPHAAARDRAGAAGEKNDSGSAGVVRCRLPRAGRKPPPCR